MRHVCGDCASKREHWDPRARDRPPFYRLGAAQNHRLLLAAPPRDLQQAAVDVAALPPHSINEMPMMALTLSGLSDDTPDFRRRACRSKSLRVVRCRISGR
jgi:hypothetical protein